jgi:glycerophosphoryl diester phosphodiesterase
MKKFDWRVCAHRGFRAVAPENTILAAQKGYEAGAGWWELDVAASSDEVLIIMHDENLKRTTDAEELFPGRPSYDIYDWSFADLRKLDAGSWYEGRDQFGQVASGRLGQADFAAFRGQRLPTLEEALDFTARHSWRINIEIKNAEGRACDPWIVERVVDMVRAKGLVDSTHISSFNHSYIKRVRSYEPRLDTGALVEGKLPEDCVNYLLGLGSTSINPDFKLLDEKTVKAIRAAGVEVFPWTVNEKADMVRLLDWGVSGIITDFPDRLVEVVGRASS